MPNRYQQLRQAVAALAAPAEEQVRHLDETFTWLARDGSAAGYGNDELALGLDDIFHAANDMIEHGELTQAEKQAIQPLDELLVQWSGQENADFWRREALFHDADGQRFVGKPPELWHNYLMRNGQSVGPPKSPLSTHCGHRQSA